MPSEIGNRTCGIADRHFPDNRVNQDIPKGKADEITWGSSEKDARFLNKLRRLLGKTDAEHRKLILAMARHLAT
jgi:hypothetical protein